MYSAIVFLPLIGFLIAGIFGRIIGPRPSEIVTSALVSISALLSWIAFIDVGLSGNEARVEVARWITSGTLQAPWAFRIDTLTAVMLVVVNTVSALVHIYSIGYMAEDPHRPRFFAYLSLFTFAMLMLVTADNLVQLFFGWEGVGLASYLLIGFWYERPSANAAAIKAFIVNRIGDFGFALGIFGVYVLFNSVEFDAIFSDPASLKGRTMEFLGMEVDALTTVCLLLFMGAMGKSAQFLLHTWLPDAMEGPTPVSALIHAATMVTAGVFMVARLSPLFEQAPAALAVVTLVGATTAFFAATVGLVQNDIKRIVAYSTCSQLGYMFVALGAGAYSVGIFHLFTHAFFKALLFLGAGSVIRAMHHEQDIRRMGGLKQAIPFTYWMMVIGTLALTGFPFTAGYYSKDAVIESAFAGHNAFAGYAFGLTVVAALLTSFYSWRLIFLTFHGSFRGGEIDDHGHGAAHAAHHIAAGHGQAHAAPLHGTGHQAAPDSAAVAHHAHPHGAVDVPDETIAADAPHMHEHHGISSLHEAHESPLVMLVPLAILAFGSLFAGLIFEGLFVGEGYSEFWRRALAGGEHPAILEEMHHAPLTVALLPTLMMAVGFLIAYWFYLVDPAVPRALAERHDGLYKFLLNKWYFDELYDRIFTRPAMWLGRFLWKTGDGRIIDGLGPDGISARVVDITRNVVRLQSGYLYHYAFAMLVGVAALITWMSFGGGAR